MPNFKYFRMVLTDPSAGETLDRALSLYDFRRSDCMIDRHTDVRISEHGQFDVYKNEYRNPKCP
jgi:hypothetical protein